MGIGEASLFLYSLMVAKDKILATLCSFLESDTTTFGYKVEESMTNLLGSKIVGLLLPRSADEFFLFQIHKRA